MQIGHCCCSISRELRNLFRTLTDFSPPPHFDCEQFTHTVNYARTVDFVAVAITLRDLWIFPSSFFIHFFFISFHPFCFSETFSSYFFSLSYLRRIWRSETVRRMSNGVVELQGARLDGARRMESLESHQNTSRNKGFRKIDNARPRLLQSSCIHLNLRVVTLMWISE